MNKTITEVEKNSLEEINIRTTEAEEQINNLEDKMVEIIVMNKIKKRRKKRNENSLRDLWNNITCISIQIILLPEEEKEMA